MGRRSLNWGQLGYRPLWARGVLLNHQLSTPHYIYILFIPDKVRDTPRPALLRCFPVSDSFLGGTLLQFRPPYGPSWLLPSPLFSRAFTIPLRSSQVVRSGAKLGGFWFHPLCSKVSSVREGQFMAPGLLKILQFVLIEYASD